MRKNSARRLATRGKNANEAAGRAIPLDIIISRRGRKVAISPPTPLRALIEGLAQLVLYTYNMNMEGVGCIISREISWFKGGFCRDTCLVILCGWYNTFLLIKYVYINDNVIWCNNQCNNNNYLKRRPEQKSKLCS